LQVIYKKRESTDTLVHGKAGQAHGKPDPFEAIAFREDDGPRLRPDDHCAVFVETLNATMKRVEAFEEMDEEKQHTAVVCALVTRLAQVHQAKGIVYGDAAIARVNRDIRAGKEKVGSRYHRHFRTPSQHPNARYRASAPKLNRIVAGVVGGCAGTAGRTPTGEEVAPPVVYSARGKAGKLTTPA
jgi:hypothetical protein